MADSSGSTTSTGSSPDRRNFLKIGAGVVGGLVVGAGIGYLAKGSSTTTSTSTSTEMEQGSTSTVTSTATATSTATTTATVSGPTTTDTVTSTSVSTLPAQTSTETSTVTTTTTTSNTSQIAAQQAELMAYSGIADALITLQVGEANVIAAAANVIIPADSNGPGAAEAGAIYFIDRQLWGEYGQNGRIYSPGPFIQVGTPGPLTVNSSVGPITYTSGTQAGVAWGAPQRYEYGITMRNFWRFGISSLQAYANSAYGGNFETLTAANQAACLGDLFNNKPTTFGTDASGGAGISPVDFANELFYMVWCGFLMDPMYGGNRGMVGWKLTASPGLNSGNFYGEGETPVQRATATTPTILGPVSNAQFQQSLKISGVLSP